MKKYCYIHAGKFHLDDFLCAAMALILGYTIVRKISIDFNELQSVDIVCDIGRRYDGVQFFDHHQPDVPYASKVGLNTRFPFTKVAGAGLLWAAKGKDIIRAIDPKVPQEVIQEVIDSVDINLIAPSDKIDTEGSFDVPPNVCTLSSAIGMLNPISQKSEESDKVFFNNLPFIVNILKSNIVKTINTIYGRKVVDTAPIVDGKIIVLPVYTPWVGAVNANSKFDNCVFCIYPSNRGGWSAHCIPNREGPGYRRLMPIEWIGAQNELECAKAMGFSEEFRFGDNYFCHEGRFIAAFPTKEIAIAACQKALKN